MTMVHRQSFPRLTAFACLAFALIACAPVGGDRDETSARAEIAALQDAWVAAEIAGDAAALRSLMDERMVTVLSSGETLDREGYIDWIVNMDIKPFTAEIDRIDFHGDAAVIISHFGERTKIAWTAVKKDGRWLGVSQAFAKTPAPGGAADSEARAPIVTTLDGWPREQLSPDTVRQALHGEKTTISRWTLKAGSSVPMHAHPNEQTTIMLSGRSVASSGGKTYELDAGDVMLFPPNVEHAFSITEDAVILDFFAPRRDDWIEAARAAAPQ